METYLLTEVDKFYRSDLSTTAVQIHSTKSYSVTEDGFSVKGSEVADTLCLNIETSGSYPKLCYNSTFINVK